MKRPSPSLGNGTVGACTCGQICAVAVDRQPRLGRRIEAHDVEVAPRRALGAVRHVHAVPDRRMRLLQRLELHRHVADGEVLAVVIEHLAGEALHHKLDRLAVDLLRLVGIGAVIFDLDRRPSRGRTRSPGGRRSSGRACRFPRSAAAGDAAASPTPADRSAASACAARPRTGTRWARAPCRAASSDARRGDRRRSPRGRRPR